MKKTIIATFSFLVLGCTVIAQTRQLTLQQCIDSALARNLQIKLRGLQIETAAVNYNQAKAARLPDVNATIDHGIQQGRSIDPFTNAYVNQKVNYAGYSLGSGITLFNGLSLKNNIRQNAYAADAARMDKQQEQDNVTLNVILAYLQMLNNEDLAALSKAQAGVTQQQVNRLEILNREGAISPPILFDLRGQLKGEEAAVVNALNAVEVSKLTLLQLMNLPYDSTITIAREGLENTVAPYEATADAVYKAAIERMAVVKATALRKQSAEAAVKVWRGQLYPSLSLGGNATSNYSSLASTENLAGSSDVNTGAYVLINGGKTPVMATQNNYVSQKIPYSNQIRNNVFTNVGITLRVPLLNGLQTRSRIRLAQIDVKTAALAEENTRLLLRQAIEQAHLNMINSWKRYNVLLEQVAAYAESFRAAEVRFNAGVGTLVTYSVDYLLAKARLDNANLNLIVAKYDYVLRTKVLDYYRGAQ
jgi:outer membrane protein